MQNNKFGFDLKQTKKDQKETPKKYFLGGKDGLRGDILREDGQYLDFIPKYEAQKKNNVETMNCTNYGTLSTLENIHIFKYHIEKNWSERDLGIKSGTTQSGNSPHTVAEHLRLEGVVEENILPFDSLIRNWFQYYYPKPLTEELKKEALKWLDIYKFGHDWIFPSWLSLAQKQQKLMEALKSGPCGISAHAWSYFKNGLYYKGGKDNHWVSLIGYVKGKYWIIYDSYEPFIKKLEWNYNFGFAKRYLFIKKNTMQVKNDYLYQLIEPPGGFALGLDGKLIIDDLAKVVSTFIVRNKGKMDNKLETLTLQQWNSVEHINLKRETIKANAGGKKSWLQNFINLFK